MGDRPTMFSKYNDEDGADEARGAHGVPQKVSLLNIENMQPLALVL